MPGRHGVGRDYRGKHRSYRGKHRSGILGRIFGAGRGVLNARYKGRRRA